MSRNSEAKRWDIHTGKRPRHSVPNTIFLQPNCMDVLQRQDSRGFIYEEIALGHIASNNQSDQLLGPHLIDKLIPALPQKHCKPDIMRFKDQSGTWILNTMYEVKSGTSLEEQHKLTGFLQFVNWLRFESDKLTEKIHKLRLASTDPRHKYWPDCRCILIPNEADIDVIFISPTNPNGELFNRQSQFRSVSHEFVPFIQ